MSNPPPSLPLRMSGNQVSSDETIPMSYASKVGSSQSASVSTIQVNTQDNAAVKKANQWQQQRSERRRMLKQASNKVAVVYGNRNNDGNIKLKKAVNTKDVYIRDIDPDITDADIVEYMKSNASQPRFVRQILGKRDGQKKSFKITVIESDFEKVMNADFWPKDIECREWYTAEQLRMMNDAAKENSNT